MKKILIAVAALFLAFGIGDVPDMLRVARAVRQMPTRDKVAQLVTIAFESYQGTRDKALQDSLVAADHIGGIIAMNDTLPDCIERINHLQSLSKIPLLVCLDAEWGASMRFKEYPSFPRQRYLGRLDDESLVYEMGRAVGRELMEIKINVNFAPVVDIYQNPSNTGIRSRSFGQDKEKVARFGSAYARGMQDEGVVACAKHFPGHGDTAVNSHYGLPVLDFPFEKLDSVDLYPFKRLIADGVEMVMVGHLSVPSLDSTGTPASLSRPIVTGLLRERLGFKGVIVTDALEMKGAKDWFDGSGPLTCLAAYEAGADILLMPNKPHECIDLITSKIESGELSEKDLDRRVARVLMMKSRLGMLDDGYDRYIHSEDIHVGANASFIETIKKSINGTNDEKDAPRVGGRAVSPDA